MDEYYCIIRGCYDVFLESTTAQCKDVLNELL